MSAIIGFHGIRIKKKTTTNTCATHIHIVEILVTYYSLNFSQSHIANNLQVMVLYSR